MEMLDYLIRNIPLFSDLPLEELTELGKLAEKRRYRAGDVVFFKGDSGQFMYLILKGRVNVVITDETGGEIILSQFAEGEYFGEMSALDDMPRSADVVTTEESEFLVISHDIIRKAISKNPDMALKLLSEMSKRLREANQQINDLVFLDMKGRVARVLLKLSKVSGLKKGGDPRTIARPSARDLSSMVGGTRETISRVLNDFSKRGLVSLEKKKIIIYEGLGSEYGLG